MENENKRTCLSCKIVSVCCLCGIGGYLLHTSKLYKRGSKATLILIGLGTLTLGIGEIFNEPPIRK